MADTIPMLRKEQRRHLLMNGWLIAGFVVAGTAVTNERGIFAPLGFEAKALSATARAFAAIAAPAGLQQLRDVYMIAPMEPFDATSSSRDLRRRLMDSLSWMPGDAEGYDRSDSAFANGGPGGPGGAAGGTGDAPIVTAPAADGIQIASADPTPDAAPAPGPTQGFTPSQTLFGGNPDVQPSVIDPGGIPTSAVPEPSAWAMLIAGFGIIGFVQRKIAARRRAVPIEQRRRRKLPAYARAKRPIV